jgi:transcriptional regulator with XRE-family HTH domain
VVLFTIYRDVEAGGRRVISIGRRVQDLREKRGWTQVELARRSGLSQQTVNGVEGKRKGRPEPETIRALLRAFEMSYEDFMEPDEGDRLAGLVEEVTEALEALGSREPEHAARARELAQELRLTLLDPGGQSAPPPDTNPSPPARRRSGRT